LSREQLELADAKMNFRFEDFTRKVALGFVDAILRACHVSPARRRRSSERSSTVALLSGAL
jgi:hypothetical protein